jgi:hypothetical protein
MNNDGARRSKERETEKNESKWNKRRVGSGEKKKK